MRKAKIAVVLAICVGTVMLLSGCGKPYSSYKLSDYIKVGDYKGLKVEKYKVAVSDEEINKEINTRLKAAATTQSIKSGKVKNGDTVVISYEGKINGKSFSGGSQDDFNLTIGSGQFIDGFEEGLVGVAVGKTKNLHLKFPKAYSDKDVAGKPVVFKVTVKSIQKKVTPKLDAQFVKKNSSVTSVAAYKAQIKKDLEKQKKKDGQNQQKTYLWDKIIETSMAKKTKDGKDKYPEKEVERVMEETKDMYVNYAKNYNMELKDFVKKQMGTSMKEFNKQLKSYAKTKVKEEEVIYSIAEKEKINVSKDEYESYITKTLKQYGYTPESFKETNGKSFEQAQGKANIWKAVYLEKVQTLILDKAKVVDKISK